MVRFVPIALVATAAALLGFGTQTGFEFMYRHDKLAHAVGGVLLAMSVGYAFTRWPPARVAVACAVAVVALEVIQSLLPARTASWADLMAGIGGIALGVGARHVVAWRRPIS